VTGAIGVSVGLGAFDVALMLTAVTVVTLWILSPLKRLGRAAHRSAEANEDAPADQDRPDL